MAYSLKRSDGACMTDLVELILSGADVCSLQDVRLRPPAGVFETCGAGSLKMLGCGAGGGALVGHGIPRVRSGMKMGDGSGRGDPTGAGGRPPGSGSAPGRLLSGGGDAQGNGQDRPHFREEYSWEYKDR